MKSGRAKNINIEVPQEFIDYVQSRQTETGALYIDEKGASRLTGYSPAFFRKCRLLQYGPPYRKIGRSVRYNIVELLRWIEEQAHYPAQAQRTASM